MKEGGVGALKDVLVSGASGEIQMSAFSVVWCRGCGQPGGKKCMDSSVRLRSPQPFDRMLGSFRLEGSSCPKQGQPQGWTHLVLKSSKTGDSASSLPQSY